jgi:hypothetical protein
LPLSNSQRRHPKPLGGGPNAGYPSFREAANGGPNKNPATLLAELTATTARLKRLDVLRNRLDRDRARDDKRQWVQNRRARTRHLIELGGLVQKAGLVELVDDDRATLLGAFLELAARMGRQEEENQEVSQADLLLRWRRRGLRAFEADREAAETEAMGRRKEDGQTGEALQR